MERVIRDLLGAHPQACNVKIEAITDRFDGSVKFVVKVFRDTGRNPMNPGDDKPFLTWREGDTMAAVVAKARDDLRRLPSDFGGFGSRGLSLDTLARVSELPYEVQPYLEAS